jgi:stress-induced morphogen
MYNVQIESTLFQGKSKIEQHRMVNAVLEEELKGAHGFNLKTLIKK